MGAGKGESVSFKNKLQGRTAVSGAHPAHVHIQDVLQRQTGCVCTKCVLHCIAVIEEAMILVGVRHGRSWKGREEQE